MTKKDEDNPEYTGKVLCSPGLGAGYIKRIGKRHEWRGEETKEDYYTRQGTLIALPGYYKHKLFTEEQREQLWIYREESGEKYVGSFKIKIKDEESEEYYNTRNILCTKWNDTIQTNQYPKKQLDRRILLQWKVLQ